MPFLKNSFVIDLARGLRAYLQFEAGLTRGTGPSVPDPDAGRLREELQKTRHELAAGERRISGLQGQLNAANGEAGTVVDPGRMVWIFGSGRTGSTWLSAMMGDLPRHSLWDEPLVGKMFGDVYKALREERRQDIAFILGSPEEFRNGSIREFTLRETGLRYAEAMGDDGFLVVKEPNGSIGAPLLMDALPESRMILLVRDFRDSIASYMDAHKKGGWVYENRDERGKAALDNNPDQINLLRRRVRIVLEEVRAAKRAYDAHKGPKVLIKYEDLRSETLATMKHIYSELRIPVDESELAAVVEKHSWGRLSKDEKGAKKRNRKATPGAWKDDLSSQQIRIVEKTLAPVLDEFYPG